MQKMTSLYEIVKSDQRFLPGHQGKNSEVNIKMYIIVNITPKLSRGKTCAQVGHAVQSVVNIIRKNKKRWGVYNQNGSAKIILKADEELIKTVLEETQNCPKVYVIDAGKTECPENTVTAIGYLPMYPHEVPKIFKNLPLL